MDPPFLEGFVAIPGISNLGRCPGVTWTSLFGRASKAPALRGLNPNHQRELKEIFKSAARAAVHRPGPGPQFYQQRVEAGRKPERVRLTVARKLAAVTLHLWKKGERFDVNHLKPTAA